MSKSQYKLHIQQWVIQATKVKLWRTNTNNKYTGRISTYSRTEVTSIHLDVHKSQMLKIDQRSGWSKSLLDIIAFSTDNYFVFNCKTLTKNYWIWRHVVMASWHITNFCCRCIKHSLIEWCRQVGQSLGINLYFCKYYKNDIKSYILVLTYSIVTKYIRKTDTLVFM